MWMRDKRLPKSAQPSQPHTTAVPLRQPEAQRNEMEPGVICIGQSVVIKGQLCASEDLTIAGRVEGKIKVRDHILTIAHTAHISAEISVRTVHVAGAVTGNIVATERVEIRENGSVEGDIAAPRIAVSEGAHFRGRLDMQRSKEAPKPATKDPSPKVQPSLASPVR